jgi:DNA-binding response OmpR family regulator
MVMVAISEKTRLLIVDDESDLLAELEALLTRSGYQVETARNGLQAIHVAEQFRPNLIVLDVLMPVMDGREALRQLRQADDWTPVILLTQVGASTERALSLQEGADDYLNKPFDPMELIARIQAIMRRTQSTTSTPSNFRHLDCDELTLDRQKRQVRLSDNELKLTTRALGVLEYLMLHPGETISRDKLLNEIWGWAYAVETRAVDVRIAEIRKQLGSHADWVETLVGQGYRFLGEVRGR